MSEPLWDDPDPQTPGGRDLWDRLVNEGYTRANFDASEARDVGQRICRIEAEATAAAEQRLEEVVAKAIYDDMRARDSEGRTKPWVPGGNSLKQDEARRRARTALLDTPPPASPRQGEPVGHQPEAKCRTCGHREHDHHHSAEPRWCGADFEMLGFTACPCPGFAALSEPAEAGEP